MSNTLELTVLHRDGGTWSEDEVGRIINKIGGPVYGSKKHPGYVVIKGFRQKGTVIDAIGRGRTAFNLRWVRDLGRLPFNPLG